MPNIEEVLELKQEIEEAKRDRDRKQGALDALLEQAKEFNITSLTEAATLLKQATKEEAVLRKNLEKKMDKLLAQINER